VKNIVLAVAGGLVLLAILGLFIEVRKAPAQPAAAKIDEATRKSRARRTAPSQQTIPDDPWARATVEANTRDMMRDQPSGSAGEAAVEDAAREVSRQPGFGGERVEPPTGSVPDVDNDPKLEVSTLKEEVIRDFDKHNWEAAIAGALRALEKEPGDVRMMRVLVSSYCATGEVEKGQAIWNDLPDHDQTAMNRRCAKYGVQFKN
jgi:hypothetical protein